MVDLLEPTLIRNQKHVQAAFAVEYERVAFSLADGEGIAIWGARFHEANAFPPVDQLVNMVINLDPDIADTSLTNVLDDDDTVFSYAHSFDLVTQGSGQVETVNHIFMPRPIIVANDISMAFHSNNVGGTNFAGIYYQKVRLSDAELVRQVVRRR